MLSTSSTYTVQHASGNLCHLMQTELNPTLCSNSLNIVARNPGQGKSVQVPTAAIPVHALKTAKQIKTKSVETWRSLFIISQRVRMVLIRSVLLHHAGFGQRGKFLHVGFGGSQPPRSRHVVQMQCGDCHTTALRRLQRLAIDSGKFL